MAKHILQMVVSRQERRIKRRRRTDAPLGGGRVRDRILPLARCRVGAAAIEFAFALPVLLGMVYVAIEGGRLFWTQSTLQYAVEEAVRYALVDNTVTATDVTNVAVANAATLGATASNFTVTFEQLAGVRTFVTVQAAYTFSLLTPILPVPPFNISTSSRSAVVQ